MAINLGVKALLNWVNSIQLSDQELTTDDLQDGTVLLKVVYKLKKETISCSSNSIEDRFKLIADFVERDCRFSPANGTSLSWDNIRDGINLTVEMAKVLLLLVYHDIMNDRCTLNMLDCDVEREIANLTGHFVMENESCVYLNAGLDAYLNRKSVTAPKELFARSITTSSSSVSHSSLSDDESPLFNRKRKISFVDMHTVASSSVSNSPLQEIMNTPKFQMRKMQRQMIKDRDCRDGLERELASQLTLIAQRESHINKLQHRLDKLKEEQGDQEQAIKDQINGLETKNNTLQMRLDEMLKQNKNFKSNTLLMERKVDELTDENGALSSQVRAVCSQLAIFEKEVGRLTETKASAQEEWNHKTSNLQSELNQATAQKELLTEQIQILQGKISCLEDEISRAAKEEVGENMGPVMEREMFETQISSLKNELESTVCSLKKAELDIPVKAQQLAEYQQEITRQKDLLKQQKSQSEQMIQAKDDILNKLQNEITEQRAGLHQEIQELKLQLEQIQHQKIEQVARLQQHIVACEQEVEKIKEIQREKEDLLHKTEQKLKDLETKFAAASSLLADKDKDINSLSEIVDNLTDETKKNQNEIQVKEEMLAKLLLEKSNEQDIFGNKILTITAQVEDLGLSLKQAEQEIQLKQDLLAKAQEENIQQREVLQQQIVTGEEEFKKLNEEIQVKNEQLVVLRNDSSRQSELLEEEIKDLKGQLEILNASLRKAEDQVQAQEAMLTNKEQESAHQTVVLQQKLLASEEMVRSMKEEIQTKEQHMMILKTDSSEQSELLHQNIQVLKTQVEHLSSSLIYAEENLQSKENMFAEQQLQSTQDMEDLQGQMVASQDEVKRLNADICAKVEQLTLLKTETSTHSEVLQKEIQTLKDQVHSLSESLKTLVEQVQAKENLLTLKEMEISEERDTFQNMMATSQEEMKGLREQLQAKEMELVTLEKQGSEHSDMLHQELESVKKQVSNMGDSLTRAEETAQTQLGMLTKQEQESAHQKELLTASEEKVRKMKEEIQTKEEQIMLLTTDGSEQSELLHHKIQDLKTEVEHLSSSLNHAEEDLQTKENLFADQQLQSTKDMEALQTQMVTSQDEVKRLNADICSKEAQVTLLKTETSTHSEVLQKEIQTLTDQVHSLSASLTSTVEQVQVSTLKEKEALAQEKKVLMARIVQGERDQKALNKQLEAMVFKKERLAQDKQAIERENTASLKRESVLQKEVEVLKIEKEELLRVKEKADEIEKLKRDLQEQLSAKSDAVEHYKSQMEKAVSHYNGKKKLLQESQEDLAELKNTLDVKEREVKAITMENKMLQLDLDKVQTNEKKLESMVNILEAQLALADRNLRAQNKIHGNESSATDVRRLEVPRVSSSFHTRVGVKRTMSSDSLDQSSLEDSLNTTRKLSAPDVSSTPLVRSSERVAAKRQASRTESLETLYFTPINNRRINRNGKEHNQELDSTRKDPTSSVKRRRTTQVINITLTKKTPGGSEECDETFYSLASARSQPNLSSAHSARPVAMEPFDTPAKTNGPASDQLIGLPGYRRSTIHAQPTSTFCVGAENEPDGGPDDWMRIAELQSRNKACLPHLKSSYPVESEPCGGSAFSFTDEELRLGDPSDTFRRASMMPGQLQDTLTSHRHSLMVGPSGAAAGLRSHRLSLMPGQLPSRSVCSSQLRSPTGTKRSSTLSVHQTSPEKKVKASCFPRPLTPKNKNVTSRPSSSTLRPALSPIDRRQSMMFSIDNTPTNQNYLKKGLNKLRSSTRKSPGKSSKKSPTQTSARMPSKSSHAGVGREGRIGSFKSPQAANKGQRKSPRTTSRAAKSPGLTASARKMMSRMKM